MKREIKERRKHQRVSARILIKYGNAEQFFTDYIQNISRGGFFVPTYNPLPPGTRLDISFSLPGWNRLIETEGVVVHSVHGDPDQGGQPAGMGVRFDKLREESLKLIDKYVSTLQE
jgi:uncharacterized protein (TIGR02266 family)